MWHHKCCTLAALCIHTCIVGMSQWCLRHDVLTWTINCSTRFGTAVCKRLARDLTAKADLSWHLSWVCIRSSKADPDNGQECRTTSTVAHATPGLDFVPILVFWPCFAELTQTHNRCHENGKTNTWQGNSKSMHWAALEASESNELLETITTIIVIIVVKSKY